MQIIGTEVLTNLLHLISVSLLVPVIVLLIIAIVYAVLSMGSFLTEKYSRTVFGSKNTEKLIRDISHSSNPEDMEEKVKNSELKNEHKEILLKLIANHDIGVESREALALNLLEEEELKLSEITQKTDVI